MRGSVWKRTSACGGNVGYAATSTRRVSCAMRWSRTRRVNDISLVVTG